MLTSREFPRKLKIIYLTPSVSPKHPHYHIAQCFNSCCFVYNRADPPSSTQQSTLNAACSSKPKTFQSFFRPQPDETCCHESLTIFCFALKLLLTPVEELKENIKYWKQILLKTSIVFVWIQNVNKKKRAKPVFFGHKVERECILRCYVNNLFCFK